MVKGNRKSEVSNRLNLLTFRYPLFLSVPLNDGFFETFSTEIAGYQYCLGCCDGEDGIIYNYFPNMTEKAIRNDFMPVISVARPTSAEGQTMIVRGRIYPFISITLLPLLLLISIFSIGSMLSRSANLIIGIVPVLLCFILLMIIHVTVKNATIRFAQALESALAEQFRCSVKQTSS